MRYRFETIGPPGNWRIVSGAGASNPSKMSGTMGDYVDIDIHKVIGRWTPLKFEYVGAATTDFRGVVTPAGQSVAFECVGG